MEAKRINLVDMVPPFTINIVMGFSLGGFAALLPMVRDDFHLTRTQVGFYTTFLFLASFASAIFAGYLIDRLGIRKGLAIGGLVMGSFIALYGLAPNYSVLLVFAFGAGLGQSLLTPAGNKAIIAITPGRASNTIMGFFRSGVGVGSLMGAAILPAVALHLGWRFAAIASGLICLGLAISIFNNKSLANRDREEEGRTQENDSFKKEVRDLLEIPDFRFLLLSGFSFAAVLGTLIGYLPLWLHETGGLSLYHAGLGLGLAQAGGVVGRPFWGFLSDRFQFFRQDMVMVIQSIIVILVLGSFALVGGILTGGFLLTLSFVVGFAGMGFGGVYFGFLGNLAGVLKAGVATGLALSFIRLAVVAFPPLFGLIADYTNNYTYSWFLILLFPTLSIFYFFSLRNKKAKKQNS